MADIYESLIGYGKSDSKRHSKYQVLGIKYQAVKRACLVDRIIAAHKET